MDDPGPRAEHPGACELRDVPGHTFDRLAPQPLDLGRRVALLADAVPLRRASDRVAVALDRCRHVAAARGSVGVVGEVPERAERDLHRMSVLQLGREHDVDEDLEAIHPLASRQEALLPIEPQPMRVRRVDDLVAAKLGLASAGAGHNREPVAAAVRLDRRDTVVATNVDVPSSVERAAQHIEERL